MSNFERKVGSCRLSIPRQPLKYGHFTGNVLTGRGEHYYNGEFKQWQSNGRMSREAEDAVEEILHLMKKNELYITARVGQPIPDRDDRRDSRRDDDRRDDRRHDDPRGRDDDRRNDDRRDDRRADNRRDDDRGRRDDRRDEEPARYEPRTLVEDEIPF